MDDNGEIFFIVSPNNARNGKSTSTTINDTNRDSRSESTLSNDTIKSHATSERQRKLSISKKEWKTAFTLFIVTAVFLVCWGPWFLTETTWPVFGIETSPELRTLFYWITVGNSMLNPFIYTFFIPNFRKAFKVFFLELFSIPNKFFHFLKAKIRRQ